ncbi:hypothetical protein EJB05_43207 [Eragrostis curvula]|uniref:Uncharacterized protein n=1 Tax=Eragrostis curvula TaxID=38414 RepID=A0A5J9TEH4_9POAL|nr:hypothetical protein EJB05_43207 [Eragrostis curvula]
MGEVTATVVEPPRPKSPPRYPDLCGRRRLQLELQILNREIDFLKCLGDVRLGSLLKKGGGMGSGSGAARLSVLRVEGRVGVSPSPSLSVLASWTRTRHGSSGTIMSVVRSCRGKGAALHSAAADTADCGLGLGHSSGLFMTNYNPLKEFNQFQEVVKKRRRGTDPAVFFGGSDQNCAHACHGFAALASACPSAKNQVASIAPAAHAPMSAANQAATHVTSPVDQTAVRVVMCRAANLIAHPVARSAVRAANQAAVGSRSLRACGCGSRIAAPAASQAAPAATPAADANNAGHVPAIAATASQTAAAAMPSVAPARNAARALGLSALTASVASSPSNAPTCSGAPASSASTASRRAARAHHLAVSASRRVARNKMAAGAVAANHASESRSLRVPDVLAGVFGPAEIVQKDVDVLDAVIHAVPLDAYVKMI